jgi:hypothetical protein
MDKTHIFLNHSKWKKKNEKDVGSESDGCLMHFFLKHFCSLDMLILFVHFFHYLVTSGVQRTIVDLHLSP